jgi:magnesium chelatase family protein
LAKLSGPLLDRIDIHVEVPAVPYRELTSRQPGTDSATMRGQVTSARAAQSRRFSGDGTSNARMDSRQLKKFCDLSDGCLLLMKQAMDELGLSARAYDKVRRVARTIADMEGSAAIQEHHVAEAVQYRLLDRKF